MVVPSPEVCVKCKGRFWCSDKCFILDKFNVRLMAFTRFSSGAVEGLSPPGVFVSSRSYPKVSFSPMLTVSSDFDPWLSDNSELWFGLPLENILSFRQSLLRGSFVVDAKSAVEPSYDVLSVQESLLSSKSVGVEAKLDSLPKPELSFSEFYVPIGPESRLESFKIVENVKANRFIERAFYDFDLKANVALSELFSKGVGVSQLSKIFSAGMLGLRKKRVFVPTRWSITAVDSSLSDNLISEKVKFFSCVDSFLLFSSNYLGNYYYVIFAPFSWSFELLEVYCPNSSWNFGKEPLIMSDHEFFGGRSSYAENTAGGYYAVRLAVSEYLAKVRKQACVIVLREIREDLPSVGVWKCREIVRDALSKKPLEFSSLGLVFAYLEKRLSVPLNFYLKKSVLLDNILHQKRIFEFV
ncbi:MAG: hypothetical protein QXZ13_01005 [Candidatus Diapherotrites archaeon]